MQAYMTRDISLSAVYAASPLPAKGITFDDNTSLLMLFLSRL